MENVINFHQTLTSHPSHDGSLFVNVHYMIYDAKL